ncbi:MAG: Sapep family Mn(2+)-dependent dipeptidase [Clostridia bacterium]|nr:Sapep family Mn(2+)-dependent dipeptidase [Clostridia bacterium]
MEILEYLEKHKKEIIDDIFTLVRIPSVAVETDGEKPYGEKCAEALDVISEIAVREGMSVKNVDYYAVSATYGKTPEKLGILTHVDVVPEGEGWQFNPFFITELDGKIYGRGVADDKGAAVMSVWAIKAIKELGIPLSEGVRLIFGSGEEIGCRDMEYYMSKEKMPPYVFSPDASFPIINTEKGRYCETFSKSYTSDTRLPCLSYIKAGDTVNVIPQKCFAMTENLNKNYILEAIEKTKDKLKGIKFELTEKNNCIKITAEGRSAHASTPNKGKNALTAMMEMLSVLPLSGEPFESIKKLSELFPYADHYGEALNARVKDGNSGNSTYSLDILECSGGNIKGAFDGRISLNADYNNTIKPISKKFNEAGFDITYNGLTPPHHVNKNSMLVKGLGEAYEFYTGKKASCHAMGGFTYVHDIENAVAFGPLMPRHNARIHGPNEHMYIDEIIKATAIFARAIINICS